MSKFNITAQIQLQAPANAKQVVQQIQRQLSGVNVNLNVQNAPQAVKQVNNLTKATQQASTAANKLGKDLSISIKRYAGMAIATRAVSLFTNTLGNAVSEAISFERELVKVAQVTGRSIQDLRGLTNEITRLSTALGASSTELINVSRILSQAGLSARETKVALDALARSTLAPTFDNITQTAEGAVAIFNQFQQGAAALEKQLGAINAVAGKFAVEAGDLIAVIRRTGGVFKAAGGDLNELIALFTSVRATTRESAESIATGLRTIFTRIQRPKTIDFLREFGVELTDLDGKFVGPFEAVKRLSNALAGLEQGDLSFIKIAEQLGGFRQIGKVIPLIQEFRISQEALNVAIRGGDSLTKDALTAQQALAVRISKVKEEFLALVRAVTETPTFQLMANTALNLASAFLKVANALKPLLPLIGAFAAINFAKGAAGVIGGLAKGFNKGGVVPGSGNRDTVPAMLTPGEFVIRKASAQKLGMSNLQNMNKYALGGRAKISQMENIRATDGDTFSATVTPTGDKFQAEFRPAGYDAYETNRSSRVNQNRIPALQKLNPEMQFPPPKGSGKGRGVLIPGTTRVTAGKTAFTAAAAATQQYQTFLSTQSEEMLKQQVTDKDGAFGRYLIDHGSQVPVSNFLTTGRYSRGMATGGAVGTDTIPALLTPGEFVVNRKSAQSVGYGALNRMNKFAKFADGGIVQGFQGGTSGSGAKPMAAAAGGSPPNDPPDDKLQKAIKAYSIALKEAQAKSDAFMKQEDALTKQLRGYDDTLDKLRKSGENGAKGNKAVNRILQMKVKAEEQRISVANKAIAAEEKVIVVQEQRAKAIAKAGAAKSQAQQQLAQNNQGGVSGGGFIQGQARINNKSAQINTIATAKQNIASIKNAPLGTGTRISPQNIGLSTPYNPNNPGGPAPKTTQTATKNTQGLARATKKAEKGMFGIGTKVAFATSSFQAMLTPLDENSSAMLRNTHSLLQFGTALAAAFEVLDQVSEAAGIEGGPMGLAGDLLKGEKGRLASKARGGTRKAFQSQLGDKGMGGAISKSAGRVAGVLTNLAAAAGLAVGAFMLFQELGNLINELSGNTKRLNDAIKEGKVAQAERAAGAVADVKSGVTVAGGAAAGGIMGAAIGSIIPVIGTAIGGVIGASLGGFIGGFLSPSREAFVALAGAQAQAVASTKAMAKAQEEATEALDDYQRGQISSDELLQPLIDSQQANAASQKKEMQAEQESAKSGGTFSGAFRQAFGLETSVNEIESANQQSQEDRNKQLKQTATPIIQARARAVAAGGGDRQQFLEGLVKAGLSLKQLTDAGVDYKEIFDSVNAEIARATKQFQALNLGLTAVNATSAASALALQNLGNITNLADNSSLERSLAILEAGVTGAAMGINQADFAASVKEGSDTLRSLGASGDQIAKFERTTKGINQLQRSTPSIVDNMQKELLAQAKDGPLNVPEIRQKFADTLATDLKGLVDPDLLTDITSLIADGDLEQGDVDKIASGDLSPLKKLVDNFGEINLAEFKTAMEDAIKVQKELAQLTAQRIDLENKLVTAQQGVINAQMEAAEIIAEFGGPAVTPEQRTQNILAGANAQSSVIGGVSNLQTGSADELRKRNSEIQAQLQSIQSRRSEVAQGDSTLSRGEGTELQAAQDRLTKLAQDQLGVTRKLIDARKLELKQIQARNAEEKKGLESLLEGDFESFFDAQAATGATAALATGNTQLASSFGSAGLAGAFKNLQNMQSQGVQSVFGQQIGGAGGLLEQSGAAALGQFGMAGSASTLAGTTQEEQAIQGEIRDLASTLPETAQIQADAANMLLEAAKMQIRAAEAELSAIGKRMGDATGGQVSGLGQFARGGMVYASRGIFVPKGTDTVPAMLTPGEFVVRRSAVQRGNNLSILKSMNSGGEGGAQGLSRGGRVNYLANGGQATGGGFGLNAEVLNNFSSALNSFNTQLAEHIQNLQNIQLSVTLAPTNINVNLTGTSFLETLTSTLKSELMNFVSEEIKNHSVGSGGKLTKDTMGV